MTALPRLPAPAAPPRRRRRPCRNRRRPRCCCSAACPSSAAAGGDVEGGLTGTPQRPRCLSLNEPVEAGNSRETKGDVQISATAPPRSPEPARPPLWPAGPAAPQRGEPAAGTAAPQADRKARQASPAGAACPELVEGEGEGRSRESFNPAAQSLSDRRMTMGGDFAPRAPSDPAGRRSKARRLGPAGSSSIRH
jgi:hypothetical protein